MSKRIKSPFQRHGNPDYARLIEAARTATTWNPAEFQEKAEEIPGIEALNYTHPSMEERVRNLDLNEFQMN